MKHGSNRSKIISLLKSHPHLTLSSIAKSTTIPLSSTHFTLNKYSDFFRDTSNRWSLVQNQNKLFGG